MNHVLLHQTVVGQEAKKQMALVNEKPDYVIGCVGGGSNFGGLALPFVKDKLKNPNMKIIGVEPTACPSLSKGLYKYDFGDTSCFTPLLKMFTLGHRFIPPGIHAGGLRYHGCSPLLSALVENKIVDALAFHQTEVFEAAITFAKAEGIVPAPETAHAIKAVVDIAKKESNKCILLNFSGHGLLDLASYDKFLSGQLIDFAYPAEDIQKALKDLPAV